MKKYENVNRTYLIPRTYTIIRIDGRSFHTFTKGLDKPWDDSLVDAMLHTMGMLFKGIQGVKYAYTQSDEISLVLTDFDTFETTPWFGNNLQKMASVSASIATRCFNQKWIKNKFIHGNLNSGNFDNLKLADFDSRVFQLPNREEVINYLVWRQKDAIINSISSLAQSLYSPKQLHGKSQIDMKNMIMEDHKICWEDLETKYKMGIGLFKWIDDIGENLERHVISPDFNIPIFSEKRDYFEKIIPEYI